MGIRILQIFAVLCVLIGAGAIAQDRAVPQSEAQITVSFSPIVKKTSPAVVNIYTKRLVTKTVSPFMGDPMFEQLFGGMGMGFGGMSRQQLENSLGSGVILESDGLIVTNAHVVKNAQEIVVVLNDRREFDAKLSLIDEKSDLAILRVDTKGEPLPHAPLKSSETLEVGDIVIAIGNPFGVGQTVTSGIVSALARSTLNINDFNFFIQTDAAINPGNSGGPLVATDGGVVGINSAIYSRSGGSLGIGFAIPSEMVASVIAAEKSGGAGKPIQRAWLGFSGQQVTADIADSLGLNRPRGVLVTHVHPASDLAKKGMVVGDVITAINGRDINDGAELKFRLATLPLGDDVKIDILRKGTAMNYMVTAIAPPDVPARDTTVLKGNHPLSGVSVSNINPAVASEFNLEAEKGVVVGDVSNARGAARIVRAGDIIVSLNSHAIADVKGLQEALTSAAGERAFALRVQRDGRISQIVIR